MKVPKLRDDPRRYEALRAWANRLRQKFHPGQHFSNADLHRVVWPQLPVGAWIGIHRDELAEIADLMEDANLIRPSFGPRGGDGWALMED